MRGYQRDRVLTFLNPEADPLGRGYHIIQSKLPLVLAVIYGKGWLGSTQSELDFLPESSTDFIFAVFAEEFGLSGCLGLLALYLLNYCSLPIYSRPRHRIPTVDYWLEVWRFYFFCLCICQHPAMVIGILPVVGVPCL